MKPPKGKSPCNGFRRLLGRMVSGALAWACLHAVPVTATEAVCGAILSDGHTPSSIFYIDRDMLVVSKPAKLDDPGLLVDPNVPTMRNLYSLRLLFEAALQKVMARNDLGGFRMRREAPIRCAASAGDTLGADELAAWEADLRHNQSSSAGQLGKIEPERVVTLDELLPPGDARWLSSTYYVGCTTFIYYKNPGHLRSRAEAFDAGKGVPSMEHVRQAFIAEATRVAEGLTTLDGRDSKDIDTFARCGVLGLPDFASALNKDLFPEIPAQKLLAADIALDLGASAVTMPAAPTAAPAPSMAIVVAPSGPTPEERAQQEKARKDAAAKDALAKARARQTAENEKRAHDLAELRDRMARQTPKMCSTPARSDTIDLNQVPGDYLVTRAKSERYYASLQARSATLCAGKPGRLGPMQCTNASSGPGPAMADCRAVLECPSVDYPCPTNAQ